MMVKFKQYATEAEIIMRDLQAMDLITSGMVDTPDHKLATRIYSLSIAKRLIKMAAGLEKEATAL